MGNIIVTITTVGNQIQVSPDPARPSISKNEQVVWEIAQDNDFDVDFAKNEPFGKSHFHGRKGTPAGSGVPQKGTEDKDYKYKVNVPGLKALDPTVRPHP